MTEILLIRHGETAWNAIKRLQGHLDIPLNDTGLQQAAALGLSLQNEALTALVSSDLQRARQTAEQISQAQNIALKIDAGLRERCYGAFEGELYSDIEQKYPQAYAAWRSRDPDARFPDGVHRGETTREFHQRISERLHHYGQLYSGGKIALVAHGGVLEAAWRMAHDLPLDAARSVTIFNASINRFRYQQGRLQLLGWGDVAHLDMPELQDEINSSRLA